jgi:predicted GTPase
MKQSFKSKLLSSLTISTYLGSFSLCQTVTYGVDTPTIPGSAESDYSSGNPISMAIMEHQSMRKVAKGKDLIVFLGNTGSGKSTTVNVLGKIPMVLDVLKTRFLLQDDAKPGMRMDDAIKSTTRYPAFLRRPDSEILLFDFPGFKDSEGANEDIINAALIKSLLENARTVKAVVVTSEAEVDAIKGGSFKELIKSMRLFPEEFRKESLLLVFNKMSPDHTGRSAEGVLEISLEKTCQKNQDYLCLLRQAETFL